MHQYNEKFLVASSCITINHRSSKHMHISLFDRKHNQNIKTSRHLYLVSYFKGKRNQSFFRQNRLNKSVFFIITYHSTLFHTLE